MSSGQDEILKAAESKMRKAIDAFTEELKTVRTGRPNPDVFKKVKVECYGSSMSIGDVASISVQDGRMFVIQPFDKSNLKSIEQAITVSDLGFNPTNDGSVIRITVPALSNDRRKELIKQVAKMSEEKKVVIRGIRQEIKDKLKKLKDEHISEDEIKKLQDALEKITSKYISIADECAQKKEKELQTV